MASTGETNLEKLLEHMEPVLNEGVFTFCTVEKLSQIPNIDAVQFTFREKEAITVVLTKELADEWRWTYGYTSCWITLNIHSSLEAVGLTAAFANALKAEGISCNVVAAFYHDHIFVDCKDSSRALEALTNLSKKR